MSWSQCVNPCIQFCTIYTAPLERWRQMMKPSVNRCAQADNNSSMECFAYPFVLRYCYFCTHHCIIATGADYKMHIYHIVFGQ